MMKYKIMHRDSVIAEADGFIVTEILNPALCPSCFYKGYSLERWLKSRQINLHRVGARMLYKALHMKPTSSIEDVIAISHSVVLTDNWWIQSEFEDLHFLIYGNTTRILLILPTQAILIFRYCPTQSRGIWSLERQAALKKHGDWKTEFGGCIKKKTLWKFSESFMRIAF